MNIGAIGNQNSIFHVSGINQSASRQSSASRTAGQQDQDKLTLSPQGKKQNLLSSLMKQKENLIERKGRIMAENAEKGGSATDVKAQTDLIEEQIKNLEEQISKASSEELEPDKDEKDKDGTIYDKPATREEVQNKQISDMAEMFVSLDAAETLASVKAHIDGEISTLKSEIKSGYGNIEKKIEKLAELKMKSSDPLETAASYISKANEVAEDMGEPEAVEEETPEAAPTAIPDGTEQMGKTEAL